MRKVTTYSTLGGNEKSFMTSATVLRELRKDLDQNGILHKGMKLVVGETEATLESAEASLPEGEFTLFLTAQKVKSGIFYDNEHACKNGEPLMHNDIDWEDLDNNPNYYAFGNPRELALARMAKAEAEIREAINFFVSEGKTTEVNRNPKLAEIARRIENNMDLFD